MLLTKKITKAPSTLTLNLLRTFSKLKYSIDSSNPQEIYILNHKKEPISTIHDIPFKQSGNNSYKMVLEIPQNRIAKLEACYDIVNNPIVQDTIEHPLDENKTIPRFYKFFPLFNYGFMP